MRRAFTLVEFFVVLAILAILGVLLGPPLFELPGTVLVGWIPFLARSAREMSLDVPGILTAIACLILLGVGVHSFGHWFTHHRAKNLPTDTPKPAWRLRSTAAIVGLLVLMFVAGIAAIGLTHQTYWLATSPEEMFSRSSIRVLAARTQSANNLKQMAYAAHAHHKDTKSFPPGVLLDSAGRALHGWPTLLLPYLEQEPLYRSLDLKRPWNHSTNVEHMKTELSFFQNPALDPRSNEDGFPLHHYAANIQLLGPGKSFKIMEIPDGSSNTILFGEVANDFHAWGSPWHLRDPARGFDSSPNSFGVTHERGANFVMADGSVRFLSKGVSPSVLRALATPSGGEKVDVPD